uniref:Lipoprotein n=1 Tax=Strongyloides papillosus TaxID=174720 RepID=A0A0N5BG87_STREA
MYTISISYTYYGGSNNGFYVSVFGNATWDESNVKNVWATLFNNDRPKPNDTKKIKNNRNFTLSTYIGETIAENKKVSLTVTFDYTKGEGKKTLNKTVPTDCLNNDASCFDQRSVKYETREDCVCYLNTTVLS